MEMMSREEAIKRFKAFASKLKKEDRILLIYHGDADGLASAVLSAKAIEKLREKKPEFFQALTYEERGIAPEIRGLIEKEKINKILILDWNVDQHPEDIKKLERQAEILIIDHHKIYTDLSSEKTVFIKAQMLSDLEPSRHPVAKICFDLFSLLVDLKKESWIAGVGILGDGAASQWPEFMEKAARETGFKGNKARKALNELTKLIVGVEAMDKRKLNQAFELFYSLKPVRILESELMNLFYKLEKEMAYWLKNFKKKAEFYPELELVFYEIKSKHYIKSALINKLSREFCPKQTLIVILDQGQDIIKFSARRPDMKVKTNELLEKAVQGLKNASAGGHIPASAGKVHRKDLNRFKENIISLLKTKAF